ncbi:MAG TPA: mycothiol system anti-sigma-R factor [Actinomycetota bacterium]|nr:mycothiol system anti-sigma-R factor [Actinomycetota bacterium]
MKERCRETLERAYLFLDGEVLDDRQRIEISTHLEECAPCYERYGVEREVAMLIARLRGSTRCPEELRTRVRTLIEEA